MSFVGNHGNYLKNNKTLIGNHLRVTGNNNTITGNHNTIIGNNNTICGNHCNVTGNNNKLTGNHAFINGNNNSAKGSFIRMTGNNNSKSGGKSSGNKSSSSYISNFSFGENFGTIGDNVNGVSVSYSGVNSPVFNFNSNDDGMGMLSGLFSALNMGRSSDKKKKDTKSKKKKKQSPVEGDEWLDPNTSKRLIYKRGQWVDILDKDDDSSSEENKNSMECVICMDNRKNIIIKPCNHLCCCEDCSKNIGDNCPICRTEIEKIEKVYI